MNLEANNIYRKIIIFFKGIDFIYIEYSIYFLFLFEGGSFLLKFNERYGKLICIFLLIGSIFYKFFRNRKINLFYSKISLISFLILSLIMIIESDGFYNSAFFLSSLSNIIVILSLYKLPVNKAKSIIFYYLLATGICILLFLVFKRFEYPNRLTLEFFVLSISLRDLNLQGKKELVINKTLKARYLIAINILAGILSSFRSGIVFCLLWIYEELSLKGFKYFYKISSKILLLVFVISLIHFNLLGIIFKTSEVLNTNPDKIISKRINFDENNKTIDQCPYYNDFGKAKNLFINYANFLNIDYEIVINEQENQIIKMDTDTWSFMVRTFNWVWFINQSLCKILFTNI